MASGVAIQAPASGPITDLIPEIERSVRPQLEAATIAIKRVNRSIEIAIQTAQRGSILPGPRSSIQRRLDFGSPHPIARVVDASSERKRKRKQRNTGELVSHIHLPIFDLPEGAKRDE
ncbi:MAG TPA: hypothetical protein VGD37_11375 [Kofleriaceae bacterium]